MARRGGGGGGGGRTELFGREARLVQLVHVGLLDEADERGFGGLAHLLVRLARLVEVDGRVVAQRADVAQLDQRPQRLGRHALAVQVPVVARTRTHTEP